MSPKPTIEGLNTDVMALKAIVRALACVESRKSGAHFQALLQAVSEETGRLGETLQPYDTCGREQVVKAATKVSDWIGMLSDERVA